MEQSTRDCGRTKGFLRNKGWGQTPQTKKRRCLLKRYDICWANLDPVQSAEMAKKRPVVIVSLDVMNERLQTVTVCPVTSQLHPDWRSRILIDCAGQPAEIAVDQIRTLSKTRLGTRIGSLTSTQAAALRRLITEMYGE